MAGRTSPGQFGRARTMLDRLERISADSTWAHQASGVRAAVARILISPNPDLNVLENLLETGAEILRKAAAEIPGSDQGD